VVEVNSMIPGSKSQERRFTIQKGVVSMFRVEVKGFFIKVKDEAAAQEFIKELEALSIKHVGGEKDNYRFDYEGEEVT
jgi:hypothetical protein